MGLVRLAAAEQDQVYFPSANLDRDCWGSPTMGRLLVTFILIMRIVRRPRGVQVIRGLPGSWGPPVELQIYSQTQPRLHDRMDGVLFYNFWYNSSNFLQI